MKASVVNLERDVLQAIKSWEGVCPDKSISGLTLDQFREAIKPTLDARARLAQIEVEWQKGLAARQAADLSSRAILRRIVNAIKGDPDLGEDSAFYAALGYVKKSDRGSGLTRRREKEPASEEAS